MYLILKCFIDRQTLTFESCPKQNLQNKRHVSTHCAHTIRSPRPHTFTRTVRRCQPKSLALLAQDTAGTVDGLYTFAPTMTRPPRAMLGVKFTNRAVQNSARTRVHLRTLRIK